MVKINKKKLLVISQFKHIKKSIVKDFGSK